MRREIKAQWEGRVMGGMTFIVRWELYNFFISMRLFLNFVFAYQILMNVSLNPASTEENVSMKSIIITVLVPVDTKE